MIKSYLLVSRLILSGCAHWWHVCKERQSPGSRLVDKKKLQMKDHHGYTTQLKVVAKQSLKNIQASTEPEPMTSAKPMKKSYECGVWIFFCNYITGVAYTTAIIFHFFTFLPQ